MGRKTLQGLETEFGFTALDANGMRANRAGLKAMINLAGNTTTNMRSQQTGQFLANGGLLYIDAGDHLEWATPECMSPEELVRYTSAGEELIASCAAELENGNNFSKLTVFKGNVCYAARDVTWGCHESYLHRNFRRRMAAQLIPFLVSRVIFTGAGGLSSRNSGIQFQLSPRVAHLNHDTSCSSTENRAIFHTKDESLTGFGYKRLHLICGDSNCSQFQTWLKAGTTMLVVALVDAGITPGDFTQLQSGLAAVNFFSADAECRGKFVDENNEAGITASAIQRSYLEMAERFLGTALMPDWAEDVCIAWRATLDALDESPAALLGKLDWPLKRALFRQRIEAHPIQNLANVALWNSAIEQVESEAKKKRQRADIVISRELVNQYRRRVGKIGNAVRNAAGQLHECGFNWDQLDEFLALRGELCELDMAFGDISQRGLYRQLDESGALQHRIIDRESCRQAIDNPPPGGRAKLRGEAVLRGAASSEKRKDCHWQGVVIGNSKLNLLDPFASDATWHDIKSEEASDLRLAELLAIPRDAL